MSARISSIVFGVLLACMTPSSMAVILGDLIVDPPGVDIVGFELPFDLTAGNPSLSTKASVEYRVAGSNTWAQAPDMMRVRPDLGTDLPRNEAFAGAIWGLEPSTAYDVRITVTEPGQSSQTVNASVTTRSLPAETTSQSPTHIVDAATSVTQSEIQDIFDNASPGDIIEFRGALTIDSGINIRRSGTQNAPIYIRGADGASIRNSDSAIIFEVNANDIVIEDLTTRGNFASTGYAIVVNGTTANPVSRTTIRRLQINSRKGITAERGGDGEVRGMTIYGNSLQGRWSRADIVALATGGSAQGESGIGSTWNDTGLEVTGQGHSIFNNTFAGYGDSIKTQRNTAIRNTTVNYSRNLILFGGDDGIELDDAFRNCVAYQNLILNTGSGVSKQPNFDTGGPNYMVRNVLVNQFLRPFKFNDSPNGIIVVHNTIVATVNAKDPPDRVVWNQFQSNVKNASILNNLWVHANLGGGDGLIRFTGPGSVEGVWDGSAYFPDGRFEFGDSTDSNLAEAKQGVTAFAGHAGGGFESKGVALASQPFEHGLGSIGPDWTVEVRSFAPELSAVTTASEGAISLAGFYGKSRGAVELGDIPPVYGAQGAGGYSVTRPRPPSDLLAQ